MESKEALSSLKEEYYIENNEHIITFNANDKRLKIIEKDLEILDILKSKKYIPLGRLNPKHWNNKDVYNEVVTYKYYLNLCEEECEYFVSENEKLTKKEFIKIMRWLNNDK